MGLMTKLRKTFLPSPEKTSQKALFDTLWGGVETGKMSLESHPSFGDHEAKLLIRDEFSPLYMLSLSGTRITDYGLLCLSGLINLIWLDLTDTQVTESGVKRLFPTPNSRRFLPALRILRIGAYQISECLVKDLQAARPSLKVVIV